MKTTDQDEHRDIAARCDALAAFCRDVAAGRIKSPLTAALDQRHWDKARGDAVWLVRKLVEVWVR